MSTDQQDAARYRWLRLRQVLAWERSGDRKARFPASHGAELDAAVDAELAAEAEQKSRHKEEGRD